MKNIFKIYKRDIKNIFTNWVAFVVTLALVILPSLYGWFNIKSSWDPYGNTKGIKVAIVNKDKGGSFKEKEYKIGDEIESNLKENDQIGWEFVSEEEAEDGVRNGKYYASIKIPENFSSNLLSITTDNIVEPSLEYTVNEKTNAIAPKITDKGVSSVKDQVSSQVVKTVDGIIFKILNEIGIEAANARPQLRKLVDLVYKLDESMPEIQDLVNKAQEGTITIDELVTKANELMPTVEDTINTTEDVLNKSSDYLKKAQGGVEKLGPVIKEDLVVAGNVVGGVNDLLNSIDPNTSIEITKEILTKIEGKVSSLDSSLESLINLLESINKLIHNKNLTEAITNLNNIRAEVNKGLEIVNKLLEGINNGGTLDTSKFEELKSVVGRINNTLTAIVNDYDSKIMPALNAGIEELSKISNNGIYLLGEAEKSLPDLKGVLSLADKGAKFGTEELRLLNEKLPGIKEKLDGYVEKLKGLDDEAKIDEILDLITNDWQRESSFLSSPIQINENKLFQIPNYGSAMSPFFTTLSLWVGALLLVSLFTTHAKPLEEGVELRPLELYFGKYLTFISIAIAQGLVATVGDIFILKTYVLHPVLFVVYGIFVSVVFMTMIYTLVSVFGNVGKAIGVIFLVLQISASGGTFPVEVMPQFFQRIHPLLPFKYAIGGMREAVAGIVPELLRYDTILLLLYFVISLVIGITLKAFINKHSKKLVDKLGESGIVGH
ncbi:YhgE/Pip domain-containing protein [Clostridium paraputrificum]|uniref:YhgE/Pip domain-containing protein n=1 Tax=Clostridium paraputrificum TaxID=29363 RepID=UPI003D354F7E